MLGEDKFGVRVVKTYIVKMGRYLN